MQKAKKILNKSKFFIEFAVSIIFAITLLNLLIGKYTQGNWEIGKIILTLITGGIITAIIVYTIKREGQALEKIIISILIPIGMLYVFFMLPTKVPDEMSHIIRSVEISEGIHIKR